MANNRLIIAAFADPNSFTVGRADPFTEYDISIEKFESHARLVDQAGIDALFRPDFLGFRPETLGRRPRAGFEPLTLLTALARVTKFTGLIPTLSTTYSEPYTVARQLASLDSISSGRAGWNVVTSFDGEKNFSVHSLPSLDERYDRADEFLDVVSHLWQSWEPEAVTVEDGQLTVHPDRIHPVRHQGRYYRVEEALDVLRSPQTTPVIAQAGASDRGITFAAQHAELIFAAAPSIEEGYEFARQIKDAAAAHGRNPNDVKVLPGLNFYVGSTEEEARASYRAEFSDEWLYRLRDKIVRQIPGFRIGHLALDQTLTPDLVPSIVELEAVDRRRSRGLLLRRVAVAQRGTLREFLLRVHGFGHYDVVGTPEQIAAEIARWHAAGAADGFILRSGNSIERFTEEILPLLSERGLFRPDFDSTRTFRERLRAQ